MMHTTDLCSTCMSRIQVPTADSKSGTLTLWDFPFLQYRSFHEMKRNLSDYYTAYQQESADPSLFWRTHNEDGYTYTQWQIYFLSKKYHRYRGMRCAVFTLFDVLATFPFFIDLILLGTRDDPAHHTLHHYLFHMECGINYLQKKMYTRLVRHLERKGRLDALETRDARNHSVTDYYQKLVLPTEVVKTCNSLTESYKKIENDLFSNLEFLSRCRMCQTYLRPYQELVEQHNYLFEFLDKYPEWSDKIYNMLQERDQCNQLYYSYITTEGDVDSVKRHDYVIGVYRTLFEW